MPFSTRTDRLNDDDRRRIAAMLADRARFRRSPLAPAIVALAGVSAIIAAFFVWQSSLEGAATLVIVGVTMLAVGAFIAHGRYQIRAWTRSRDAAFQAAVDRGEVAVHTLESTHAVLIPDFDENQSAALFDVQAGFVLVREDVLSFLPGLDGDRLPRSLTVRILADSTVLGAFRGEADCALAPELADEQRAALFDYLDAAPERTGPICFVSADSLPK